MITDKNYGNGFYKATKLVIGTRLPAYQGLRQTVLDAKQVIIPLIIAVIYVHCQGSGKLSILLNTITIRSKIIRVSKTRKIWPLGCATPRITL